jgi:uncharacterized protein YutE (UPF0331/DUF86 family)
MTPTKIRANVVSERAAWVREMVRSLQGLPLASFDEFTSDRRNVASAESYLRRGIEALLDLGRHILAKGFAVVPAEYKEIGTELAKEGVLSEDQGTLLRQIAGYRNRMVHFYHEVTRAELYQLSTEELKDIESLLEALVRWLQAHPERLDQGI